MKHSYKIACGIILLMLGAGSSHAQTAPSMINDLAPDCFCTTGGLDIADMYLSCPFRTTTG